MEWDDFDFWDTGEWQVIQERLDDLESKGVRYNPDRSNLFMAIDTVAFSNVKCVIIGQDPYPKKRHATGMAFSIPKKEKEWPPTLVNILTEYQNDLHYERPDNGCLIKWAKEGVLLWNTVPTVLEGKPGSCKNWWEWQELSREIIQKLSAHRDGLAFVLWGGQAQAFRQYIAEDKHKVITAPHPSPLSASKGFFGSRPFSTVNSFIKEPIDWRLK